MGFVYNPSHTLPPTPHPSKQPGMLEISKSEFSAALEELGSALAYMGIACSQCQMSEQDVRMCSKPVKL